MDEAEEVRAVVFANVNVTEYIEDPSEFLDREAAAAERPPAAARPDRAGAARSRSRSPAQSNAVRRSQEEVREAGRLRPQPGAPPDFRDLVGALARGHAARFPHAMDGPFRTMSFENFLRNHLAQAARRGATPEQLQELAILARIVEGAQRCGLMPARAPAF
jgi:hypothetical protein